MILLYGGGGGGGIQGTSSGSGSGAKIYLVKRSKTELINLFIFAWVDLLFLIEQVLIRKYFY